MNGNTERTAVGAGSSASMFVQSAGIHFRLDSLRSANHVAQAKAVDLRFGAPLAYERRRAMGSELLQPRVLKRLLQWPLADLRPDLAVVLVDRDGDTARERQLRETVAAARHAATPPTVIAVAVEEIEAWLLSDTAALASVLSDGSAPSAPEKMSPGAAKTELEARINRQTNEVADRWALRVRLAHVLDLDRVARASRSFDGFRKELIAAARTTAR